MPRGSVSGATAALIQAVAEYGGRVSPYQIERWRAAGELPRPVRHGLGRGRGVVSEDPDEQTVQRALVLAQGSRRGSRRVGAHPLERFAMGRPVPEPQVRQALAAALDDVARLVGADLADDAGWRVRQAIADRAAREATSASWRELVAAADGTSARPDLPQRRKRAAVAGMVHALGAGDEAASDDLMEMLGLATPLSEAQLDEMRRAQRAAELRGHDPWGAAAREMSIRHLAAVGSAASLDHLQRALSAVSIIGAIQPMVVMFGLLDLAGHRVELGERLSRFNGAMIRTLQADPMWPLASTIMLSPKPRWRIRQMVLLAAGILAAGTLPAWEAYRDRLMHLAYPATSLPGGSAG